MITYKIEAEGSTVRVYGQRGKINGWNLFAATTDDQTNQARLTETKEKIAKEILEKEKAQQIVADNTPQRLGWSDRIRVLFSGKPALANEVFNTETNTLQPLFGVK